MIIVFVPEQHIYMAIARNNAVGPTPDKRKGIGMGCHKRLKQSADGTCPEPHTTQHT